ncbi:ATP-dependent DNA helicase PIF1 [Glycine soja]
MLFANIPRKTKEDFLHPIFDIIKNKWVSWKGLLLSYMGKSQFFKSTIQGMLVFLFMLGPLIMLLRNIDQSEGLCHGSRLSMTRLANLIIQAKLIDGNKKWKSLCMLPSQSPWPFKLIRRKFPIMLSYAMTISKSQGWTLLPRPVFSHGQLYVAISRVKSKKGLKILIHDKERKTIEYYEKCSLQRSVP